MCGSQTLIKKKNQSIALSTLHLHYYRKEQTITNVQMITIQLFFIWVHISYHRMSMLL